MKTALFLFALTLAGCHAPQVTLPAPVLPVPAETVAPTNDSAREKKFYRQAQVVEALMSQNEALQAQLQAAADTASKPAAAIVESAAPVPSPKASAPEEDPTGILTPNADGVIDLTAPSNGTEANPFAVRKLPADAVREIPLQVAGIVAGPKPSAMINEQAVEPGTVIEGFTVSRIEAAAVVLQWGEHRLRLPLADKPARVRVAF